ncbi:hypothetical protein [Sphaerisporangium aureirubrum]|uniref:Uncharacterized protein n=1 Tax=Sphaerisporangium aureirubrum TaxID=1544736 RepID=A0ABW1NI87_9ACTN
MQITVHENHGRATLSPGHTRHLPASAGHRPTPSTPGGTPLPRARRTTDLVIERLDGSSTAYAVPTFCG